MNKSLLIPALVLGLTTLSTGVFADPYTRANPAGGNGGIIYDTTNFATGTVGAVAAFPGNFLPSGMWIGDNRVNRGTVKVISVTPTTMVTQDSRYRAPLVQQIHWVAR